MQRRGRTGIVLWVGQLVDLAAVRASRLGADVVDVPGARMTWDAARRLIRLDHKPGHELDEAQGRTLGQAVLRWVGVEPEAPYGFLVRGADDEDQLGTVAYRRTMGRGARRHRDHMRLIMFGGTVRSRFLAETYLRGVGVPGAVVETEDEALHWLAEQGIPS